MTSESVTIQLKAIGRYFPVVLLIMQNKVILNFESVNEFFECDIYSNESYRAVLSFGAVYYAVQFTLWMKSSSVTILMKAVEQYLSGILLCCVTFEYLGVCPADIYCFYCYGQELSVSLSNC